MSFSRDRPHTHGTSTEAFDNGADLVSTSSSGIGLIKLIELEQAAQG